VLDEEVRQSGSDSDPIAEGRLQVARLVRQVSRLELDWQERMDQLEQARTQLAEAMEDLEHVHRDVLVKDAYLAELRSRLQQQDIEKVREIEAATQKLEQAAVDGETLRRLLVRYMLADRLNAALLHIPFLHRGLKRLVMVVFRLPRPPAPPG
jgi:DNA repair exonuclease SbcCD ATPase subunit